MRIIWEALERLDSTSFKLASSLDRLRSKESLMERTKKATADVRAPQRVIEFEK